MNDEIVPCRCLIPEKCACPPEAKWKTPPGTVEPTRSESYGLVRFERYFVSRNGGPEVEVTQEDFCRAENSAGFHPKHGCGPVATGGFGSYRPGDGREIKGRVESMGVKSDG